MPELTLGPIGQIARAVKDLAEAERFYRKAADAARDASVRKLLMELAEIEAQHEDLAHKLGEQITKKERASEEEMARRRFVLQPPPYVIAKPHHVSSTCRLGALGAVWLAWMF